MVALVVNPPESADHNLECVESKIGQQFYFKNFYENNNFDVWHKKNSSQN